MRSLKGQKVFDPRTHRQPHSLTTCFVSHAILHDEIEYFGKKSWGFGGFSGLQFPQGGGKKVTRCSWVDTSVWRPGEIPNPKNITNWHLVDENYDSPSSWMNGGSSWEWIWIFRPASYEISSKKSMIDATWPSENLIFHLILSTWAYILLAEYPIIVQGHYRRLPWEFSLYLRHCQDY